MWNLYADFRKEVDRSSLGFGKLFREFDDLGAFIKKPNYPPYNVRNYLDGSARIEIACAGFNTNELSVQTNSRKLCIKGEKYEEVDTDEGFVHRGIATRNFNLSFNLESREIKVYSAAYENGLLTIILKPVLQEGLLMQDIPIFNPSDDNTLAKKSGKELLTETSLGPHPSSFRTEKDDL